MKEFPARIHVLFAHDSRDAVVIRRGPAKRVATIGWNRDYDEFILGQWLKGRIYERRSDLSPDGKHLIYFAMNGKWDSETKGSWTAISRSPYLKAIGLWSKGDCWHGGGLFLDSNRYWINDGYGHELMLLPSNLQRDANPPVGRYGGECYGVYFPRLLRDGWKLVSQPGESAAATDSWNFDKVDSSGWTLRKIAHTTSNTSPGKGCYYDTHQLFNARTGAHIECSNWEWADFDRERLVWSELGKLFAGRLASSGVVDTRELYDFNHARFEAINAPY